MSNFIIGVAVAWLAEWLFFKFYLKNNHCNKAKSASSNSNDAAAANNIAELKADQAVLETKIINLKKAAASHKEELLTSANKLSESEARITELEAALVSKVEELDSTANSNEEQAAEISAEASEAENNLATISGIGPKLHEALNDLGIRSFSQIISADIEELMASLKEKGVRFNKANVQTWAQQATLAAQGDWGGLKALKAELKG